MFDSVVAEYRYVDGKEEEEDKSKILYSHSLLDYGN